MQRIKVPKELALSGDALTKRWQIINDAINNEQYIEFTHIANKTIKKVTKIEMDGSDLIASQSTGRGNRVCWASNLYSMKVKDYE